MYVPWDERLRIHPQDDSFLDKERWDFAATPEDHYPLLLHYHPLNLYRTQVIKQADTVLAMFLLGRPIHPRAEEAQFRLLRPVDDTRQLAVGLHSEHRRERTRLRQEGAASTSTSR